jgi:hypothetical protein
MQKFKPRQLSVGKDLQLCPDCRKNKKQLKEEGWI